MQVTTEQDDLTLSFPSGTAWVYDATPDDGTDIVMCDHSERVQWLLWEHFATRTDAPMHMWQLFGLLVVERVSTGTNGRPGLETWNTRELAALLTREALVRPLEASRIHELVAQTYRGDARDVGFRSAELAAELVRHEVLVPGNLVGDRFRPWAGTFDDLSDRVHQTWPDAGAASRAKAGVIAFAPGRKAQAAAPRDDVDTKTLTAWMREADTEQAADGSWVYTDQP
ncbi:hypothetical protein ACFQU3_06245 [Terrabacter sp. GCM10028922]|uniref:hypothetical protein n=1 Tax=Terrabacter sp. GCM10028922 TaxID=3273428 RepID=UPI00361B82D8